MVMLLLAHLVLRPNPDRADSEQYAVYSAYVEPNLTGDSVTIWAAETALYVI